MENRIKIKVHSEKDYLKWDYFIEKVKGRKIPLKIVKRYPIITFVFPRYTSELEDALAAFEKVLEKKYYLIEKPPQDSMTIIAKVTNLCNLDCQYCYDKPFRDKLGHNGFINYDQLDKAIKMAAEYAEEVVIIWHGGEPTLPGIEWYRHIYEEIIPKYPYADFNINMQTNGTMINEDWIEFALEHELEMGSSYNATQEDLRHTKADNKLGSEEHNIFSVLGNIKKAIKAGVATGVIDVMTKENHERLIDIYEFYKREGVDACFNEIHNSGEAEKHDFLFITKEDRESYDKVATEYFTYWVNDQSEKFFVDRYASEHIMILLTGSSTVCHNGGECLYHWMGLNSNGDIFPCDRPLGNKYRIGNITEFDSISEVYDSPKYRYYAEERRLKLDNHCAKCNIQDYCHGNCPMIDIDETYSAAIPNTYSCMMQRMNLLCAYKALLQTDIDSCNLPLRNFLIDKCLFLPKEIPTLIKALKLESEFGELDYSMDTASLNSKEFKTFALFNPPRADEQLVMNFAEIVQDRRIRQEDNRIERAVEILKLRAEELTEEYRSNNPDS